MKLSCGAFTLEGYSRSTIETYVQVKELNICFDIGKCPMHLVPIPQVFISHFHGDHSLGMTYYIAHRNLAKMTPGKVYLPEAAMGAAEGLINAQATLEQARRQYELIPMNSGDQIEFRRNMSMHAFATDHRIPSLGYEVRETRHKLKPEFIGKSSDEIVALKKKGIAITSPQVFSRMVYVGDSTSKVFEWHPEIMKSEILMTECTFLTDEHREEAAKRKHMHLEDILPYFDDIKSEYIVLMHFSMRYTRSEIFHHIDRLVPKEHRERILVLA